MGDIYQPGDGFLPLRGALYGIPAGGPSHGVRQSKQPGDCGKRGAGRNPPLRGNYAAKSQYEVQWLHKRGVCCKYCLYERCYWLLFLAPTEIPCIKVCKTSSGL